MAKCANPFANGGRRNPAYEPKKRNKYGAQRVGEHASRKEHNRAVQLKLLQRAGVISDLREQVPFELIPAQYSVDTATSRIAKPKLIERACRYIADFVYTDNETGGDNRRGHQRRENKGIYNQAEANALFAWHSN